jgi:hypothetical protein
MAWIWEQGEISSTEMYCIVSNDMIVNGELGSFWPVLNYRRITMEGVRQTTNIFSHGYWSPSLALNHTSPKYQAGIVTTTRGFRWTWLTYKYLQFGVQWRLLSSGTDDMYFGKRLPSFLKKVLFFLNVGKRYQITRRHILEDSNLHFQLRENLNLRLSWCTMFHKRKILNAFANNAAWLWDFFLEFSDMLIVL